MENEEKNVVLENLRPVGEFFSDFKERTVTVQPNLCRRLNESLIKSEGHKVNLHHGVDQFVERTEFQNKLRPMLIFLRIGEDCFGKNSKSEPGEIICTRTSLVQIASSAYANDQAGDADFDDGFLLFLFKRGGNYFVCEYNTPSKTNKTNIRNPGMYSGIKFENYMTLGEDQEKEDLDAIASTSFQYHAVFKADLVDKEKNITHKLFYPAKVDCIDKDGKYTEIKFRRQPMGYGRSWWRIEMTWYLQAILENNERIIVGFAGEKNGVRKVTAVTPEDLDYERGKYWDPDVCLEYLSNFLTAVKEELDKAEENTYFHAVRQANQSKFEISLYDRKE